MTFGAKENEARVSWMDCRLLLGSKSPRRRELLSQLGLPCRLVDIDVDETLSHAVEADRVAGNGGGASGKQVGDFGGQP